MDWQTVYNQMDFMSEHYHISNVFISPVTLTVVLIFHDWDIIARRYLNATRYCHIGTDGSIAYYQGTA